MVCSARLGCVPREQELIDWGGDDDDADDPVKDEEDAGWPWPDDCSDSQSDECCRLLRECEDGNDDDLCAMYEQACETTCRRDGDCEPDCGDDPDCLGDYDCDDLCGSVPDPSEEHCRWSCELDEDPANRCFLVPADGAWAEEQCDSADGPGVDEDCNGLADCEDPACQVGGDCPEY
jgi:hypothetical protein